MTEGEKEEWKRGRKSGREKKYRLYVPSLCSVTLKKKKRKLLHIYFKQTMHILQGLVYLLKSKELMTKRIGEFLQGSFSEKWVV